MTRLLVITGVPATGKSTVARRLARRWSVPLIAKDRIKEPLLDVLGAPDAAASRRLSDASFAVLFAVAHELLAAGASVLLEGNFRPEHAATLRELLEGALAAAPDATGADVPGGSPVAAPAAVADGSPGAAAGGVAGGSPSERPRERPIVCAQLLCVAEESVRLGRLAARAADSARHAGHRDAEQARSASRAASAAHPIASAAHLDIPGERFSFSSTEGDWTELAGRLDLWWRGC